MKTKVCLMAFGVLCLLSCSENEVVNPISVNTPSYASSINAFSYSVEAEQFTSNIAVPLTFTSDSLAYSLSVTGYLQGSGSIVLHGGGMFFRSADLSSNMSVAMVFSMRSAPDTATITLTRFSGFLSFAVAGIPRSQVAHASMCMIESKRLN